MSIECSFKALTSARANELLQSHNSLTFKLLKTVADFSQALATLHDRFGHELQMLVETFRKRNGELRKERLNCPNGLFQIWELFLQQVEVNSQQHGDISRELSQTSGSGLIERVFHRKIQSKKIFAHKERIETILFKSNELLLKCYKDYCQAYALALSNPGQFMSEYIGSHNVYVHQLQATNGMVHAYQTKTLPRLLEELEECHLETNSSITSSLLSSSQVIREKSSEQANGYENLAAACRQVAHKQDLASFVKVASSHQELNNSTPGEPGDQGGAQSASGGGPARASSPSLDQIRYHQFQAANLSVADTTALIGQQVDLKNMHLVPTFKNEIAPDLSQPPAQQQPQLEKDREQLEERIERFEERIESLSRLLARSSESRLHNKVNELQEELSSRRFDLLVAQIHLSAVRSQLQLFEYNFRPGVYADASSAAIGGSTNAQSNHLLANNLAEVGELAGAGQADHQASNALSSSRKSPSGSALAAPNSGSLGPGTPLGYRHKWIKAFKSLKETPAQPKLNLDNNLSDFGQSEQQQQAQFVPSEQQQNSGQVAGQFENQHCFQEYTFKKIASCDVCKDFLRGHMRQGVKCKLCKISCHNDCQSKAHSTIKCQQPKIKLLRRQKSAGELEVNQPSDGDNADQSERSTISSKPDSIYSLIRQVLDAKKRGGSGTGSSSNAHHANDAYLRLPQQQQQQPLTNSQLINLSTGNLALANQNGKSVSTSALGQRPEASVDRWSVVMDLLAQSRLADSNSKGALKAEGEPGELAAGAKRHSKQLDKFKLAAKSAAAASKHQRHQLKQQQEMAANYKAGSGALGALGSLGPHQQAAATSTTTGAAAAAARAQLAAQVAPGSGVASMGAGSGVGGQSSGAPASANQVVDATGGSTSSPASQAGIHHTKSLPIGKLPPQQPPYQFDVMGNLIGHPAGLLPAGEQQHLMHPQQQQQHHQHQLHHQQQQQHHHHQQQQQQQQPPANYQLLNISQQQLQSTSAPHSPQRKRFNLRMKSFSLDSPETPSISYTTTGVAGNSSSSVVGPVSSSIGHTRMTAAAAAATSLATQPTSGQMILDTSYLHFDQQEPFAGLTNPAHSPASNSASGSMETIQSYPTSVSAGRQHQQAPPPHQPAYFYQPGQEHFDDEADNNNNSSNYTNSFINYQNYQQTTDSGNNDNNQNNHNYLSTTSSGGRTNRHQGAQQHQHQQQHRHSYHNPSYQYGETNELAVELQQRHSSSQSALNLTGSQGSADHRRLSSSLASAIATSKPVNDNEVEGAGADMSSSADVGGLAGAAVGAAQSSSASMAVAGSVAGQRHLHHHHHQQHLQQFQHQHQQQQQQQHQQFQRYLQQDNRDYYNLDVTSQQQHLGPASSQASSFVVLYDYVAQRSDEIQLNAGQLVQVLDTSEQDWWKVCTFKPSSGSPLSSSPGNSGQASSSLSNGHQHQHQQQQSVGYFPSSYLAPIYANERPLQVAQTIQVSNGEICDKLLRGQIVIYTGKQHENRTVTIRIVSSLNAQINPVESDAHQAQQANLNNRYIQCPEKYLLELVD